MINLYNQVPSIYTSASRDFQYLSWLYNIVLNSVKHNVDDLYNLPNIQSDPKLTELLAMTLGFKIKRNYDEKQLIALVTILPIVLKYKGTKKAIEMSAKALVKATGSLGEAEVAVKGTTVEVTLPKDLIDITLFLDLLDYILPAGMTCRVLRKTQKREDIDAILVKHRDVITSLLQPDLAWETDGCFINSTGLSNLYNLNSATLIFGKAFAVNTTSNKLKAVDITVQDNRIVSTEVPICTFNKAGTGFKIKYGDLYLSYELNEDYEPKVLLATEDKAAVWKVDSTVKSPEGEGSARDIIHSYHVTTVDTTHGIKYYLAYNHNTKQFYTSIIGERRNIGDTFELYLYQEARLEDNTLVYTPLAPNSLDSSVALNLCIVAQGIPDFTSNIKKFDSHLVLNTGLLDNAVIPTLEDSKITEGNTIALFSTEDDGTNKQLLASDNGIGIQIKAKTKYPVQEL